MGRGCVNLGLTDEHMFGMLSIMLGEGGTPLSELKAAVDKFLARAERGNVDLAQYRGVIDALEGDLVRKHAMPRRPALIWSAATSPRHHGSPGLATCR